jgi:hypothetical protein
MRKVYIVKENAYTITKLSKLTEMVLQITNFRTAASLQMASLGMASHSSTFYIKVCKDAQEKNMDYAQ